MHVRGSGEAARRAKWGRQPEKKKERLSFFVPLTPRAISHARGHLCVSRFARRTAEKRETARSLGWARNPVKTKIAVQAGVYKCLLPFICFSYGVYLSVLVTCYAYRGTLYIMLTRLLEGRVHRLNQTLSIMSTASQTPLDQSWEGIAFLWRTFCYRLPSINGPAWIFIRINGTVRFLW